MTLTTQGAIDIPVVTREGLEAKPLGLYALGVGAGHGDLVPIREQRTAYDLKAQGFQTRDYVLLARVRADQDRPSGVEDHWVRADGLAVVTQWCRLDPATYRGLNPRRLPE